MPVPAAEPNKNANESDTTETKRNTKEKKRLTILRPGFSRRSTDKSKKEQSTKSDEPAAPDVAVPKKPKQLPAKADSTAKSKADINEKKIPGKTTAKEKSGKRAKFWSAFFACFSSKALTEDKEKRTGTHADNSSLSSSQETAAQGEPGKNDKNIVSEKSVVRTDSKKSSNDTQHQAENTAVSSTNEASQNPTSASTTSPSTIQKSQDTSSDTEGNPPTAVQPSISIPPVPLLLTTPVHTPHTPTAPNDEDVDTVIAPPTPSKASHILPIEETQGLTAGAVVPPGATADDYHQTPAAGADDGNSDGTSFTDEEFHDAHEEDIEAEEARSFVD